MIRVGPPSRRGGVGVVAQLDAERVLVRRGVPGDDTVVRRPERPRPDLRRSEHFHPQTCPGSTPRCSARRPLARAHRGVDDHAPDGLIAPCRRVRSRAEIDRARGGVGHLSSLMLVTTPTNPRPGRRCRAPRLRARGSCARDTAAPPGSRRLRCGRPCWPGSCSGSRPHGARSCPTTSCRHRGPDGRAAIGCSTPGFGLGGMRFVVSAVAERVAAAAVR